MKIQLNFASKCSPGSLTRPPRPRFSSVPTTLNWSMRCIRAQTTCCVAEVLATQNIILTQKLAHYLQQPCQDRGRVAVEKKACHVFPAKKCHFHKLQFHENCSIDPKFWTPFFWDQSVLLVIILQLYDDIMIFQYKTTTLKHNRTWTPPPLPMG